MLLYPIVPNAFTVFFVWLLRLEAEEKSLLVGRRACTVPKQEEPLQTHSSICGQRKLFRFKYVAWLLLYNLYYTRATSI